MNRRTFIGSLCAVLTAPLWGKKAAEPVESEIQRMTEGWAPGAQHAAEPVWSKFEGECGNVSRFGGTEVRCNANRYHIGNHCNANGRVFTFWA